jgi:hypothetical protein
MTTRGWWLVTAAAWLLLVVLLQNACQMGGLERQTAKNQGRGSLIAAQEESVDKGVAKDHALEAFERIVAGHDHPDVRLWLREQIDQKRVEVVIARKSPSFPASLGFTGLMPDGRIIINLPEQLFLQMPKEMAQEVLVHETCHVHQFMEGRFIPQPGLDWDHPINLRKRFEAEVEAWERECDYNLSRHLVTDQRVMEICGPYQMGGQYFLRYAFAQTLLENSEMLTHKAEILSYAYERPSLK